MLQLIPTMFSYITATVFIFVISKESLNAKLFSYFDYDDSLDIDVLENLAKRLEIAQKKFNRNKKLQMNEIDYHDLGEAENEIKVFDDRRSDYKEYLFTILREDKEKTTVSKIVISKPPFTTVSDLKKVLAESDFGPLHILMSQDPKPKRVGVGYEEFDFIGRLVPAKFETMPTLCTVVNIRVRIYITSARCVFGLTAQMVHVDYVSTYVKTMAFIFAEHPTVRMYDEIGIVVTEESQIEPAEWHPIPIFDANRTDDQFQWFDDLNYEFSENHTHYIIGFYENLSDPTLSFELRQADVYVGLRFCHDLYGERLMQVPCFSPCKSTNPEDYIKPDPKCRPYLSGNGFAIVDKTKKLLLGIATWGIGAEDNQMLPGGFAIPNSKTFLENMECAEKIIKITNYASAESPDLSNCGCPEGNCLVEDGDDVNERKAKNGSRRNLY